VPAHDIVTYPGGMQDRLGWIVVLACACGPSVAGEDGGADGSGETADATSSDASSITAATTTSMSSADTGTSSSSTTAVDDSTSTTLVLPDVGDSATTDDTSGLPSGCDPPDNPNSEVSGTTPDGEQTYLAAVFAQVGGGKCSLVYVIVLASDPDALAAGLDGYTGSGFPGELVVSLVIPDDPAPGEWQATVGGSPGEEVPAVANVTVVPNFQSPAPLLQLELSVVGRQWNLSGMIAAHYCDVIEWGPCGA
jgi:hypothetical protein